MRAWNDANLAFSLSSGAARLRGVMRRQPIRRAGAREGARAHRATPDSYTSRALAKQLRSSRKEARAA